MDEDKIPETEVAQPSEEPVAKVPEYSLPTADDGRHFANLIPKKNPSGGRKVITTAIVLVILAILAGAILLFRKKPAPKPAQTTQTTQQETAKTSIASVTKHYSSVNFSLTVDHPEDWIVKEPADATSPLTITSPLLQLKAADNSDTKGKIVFTVQKKTDKLPEFDTGNAAAALESLKITYAKPSQNQRGSTYISFLRYPSSVIEGALDGIYITGDSGYTPEQAIPKVDVAKVDPLITITFLDSDGKPLAIAAAMWKYAAFQKPLQTMLESLNVR